MATGTKLWSASFIAACVTNFFYQFGRYFLVPIIALYLIDTWNANKTEVGTVLASFSVSTMLIRPFCGYLADSVDRRRLYLSSLLAFAVIFVGYPLAGGIVSFTVLQVAHGLALGVLAVSANTLVIDITPSERRGEGLGMYGIMNNIAMAIGPMTAIWIHERWTYTTVFLLAGASAFAALISGSFVKNNRKKDLSVSSTQKVKNNNLLSLDRFILLKGLPAGVNMLLLAIPYGMITSYIALYSEQLGLGRGTGTYFLCMGIGIIFSRFVGGKWVDRGRLIGVCSFGSWGAAASILLLSMTGFTIENQFVRHLVFDFSALLTGWGYGLIFPAMNTLFVNLARHDQRGTASATYMTTWDAGIGIGMLAGGMMADRTTFSYVFLVGAICCFLSNAHWHLYTISHYKKNRIEQ